MKAVKMFWLGLLWVGVCCLSWGCGGSASGSVVVIKKADLVKRAYRQGLKLLWTSPLCLGTHGAFPNVCKFEEVKLGQTSQYRFGLENPNQKLYILCNGTETSISYPTGNGQLHEFTIDATHIYHDKEGVRTLLSPDCFH